MIGLADLTLCAIQKTNDPRDLEPPQLGGGLNSNPEAQAHHAKDPYIPSQEIANNIEQPKVRTHTLLILSFLLRTYSCPVTKEGPFSFLNLDLIKLID